MDKKPGWRTSEYWLSIAAFLINAFMVGGFFEDTHIAVKIAGMIATVLAALGYTAARTAVKKRELIASGLVKAEELKGLKVNPTSPPGTAK